LDLEGNVHEAHLRFALDRLSARQPEATLVQSIVDGDGTDVRLHRRNHWLQPGWDVVFRIVGVPALLLGDGHDVHLLRHTINGAYGMSPNSSAMFMSPLPTPSSIGKTERSPVTSTIAPLPRCHITCDARSPRSSSRSRPIFLKPIPTDRRS